jgi:MFS family permease
VQRGAPDELRGRAFTVIMSTNYLFFGIGFVVAGLMRDAIGPRWVWATAGLLFAVAAVTAWVLTQGADVEQPVESRPEQALA